MEKYFLEKEIRTFFVPAETFPAGVSAAHRHLRSLLPSAEGRKYVGISWGTGDGQIVYKAAVEEWYDGEAEQCGCEIFIIRRGAYISETIQQGRKNSHLVGETFSKLLQYPGIDEKGYCAEVYLNETDVQCLVTLK